MADCVFCKIAAGEIPSNKAYEDDKVVAFKDLEPAAPVHVLLIPKKHFDNVTVTDTETLGYMMGKVGEIAKSLGLTEKGFRLVINTGDDGGQTVHHLHMHIIGGRQSYGLASVPAGKIRARRGMRIDIMPCIRYNYQVRFCTRFPSQTARRYPIPKHFPKCVEGGRSDGRN